MLAGILSLRNTDSLAEKAELPAAALPAAVTDMIKRIDGIL